MIRFIKRKSLVLSVAVLVGTMTGAEDALANGNNFSSIAGNITESISELPGLLTGVSYMLGILLGVLGILKIKDHVENPSQTPLKDGAIRLTAGGGLFALPIVYEAMQNTIGDGTTVSAAELNKVQFAIK
ncbi:MAG: hypothetical protein MRY79_04815 [Alphaproteobacteria bacterium]|nr:hypothetical protein [Alphaproteobacteria bacterium]